MELEFKPDFEQARRRWAEFWKGENKRPLVSIVLPRLGVEPVDFPPYLSWWDGNYGVFIDRVLAWAETHEFLGEAIPYCYIEWGPDTFSAFLGADLDFRTSTSWCVPFVKDWDNVDIRFRRDGVWWQRTVDFIHQLRARLDGKLLISPPTLVANLDALAAVRGIEDLLFDLLDRPDKIKRALEAVCRAHTEILDAYAEELDFDRYGSINLAGLYSTGRHSRPQCDMSCMLSPEMFREFVVPCLEREGADVDAMHYHLDGPGAVKHIEALCEINALDTINFVTGAGEAEGKDWSVVYKKIDDLGKGQARGASQEETKRLWRECKSPKQFFYTNAASRSQAEDFLEELEEMEGGSKNG